MATKEELENNIKKMQLLLKNAQSELQKQTFRDILTDLKKQLASVKVENTQVEKPEKVSEKNLIFSPKGQSKNY